MKHPVIFEKELKQRLFEILEESFFEILRIDSEEVIFYKNLKISRKKCGKNRATFHVKDATSQDYPEISNIHILDLILKDIENGN